jgi:hypothetical protein
MTDEEIEYWTAVCGPLDDEEETPRRKRGKRKDNKGRDEGESGDDR